MAKMKRLCWFLHWMLPALLLIPTLLILESSNLDVQLSAHFYDHSLKLWPYKDAFIIQKILHKGGRLYYFFMLGLFLIAFGLSFSGKFELKPYRRGFAYLLASSIFAPLIVMYLKNHTHIYCPWDLQIFGGTRPHIGLFDPFTPELPIGHCFPAAHAGSGYALLSLYFFLRQFRYTQRFIGLSFGLGMGMLYGVSQQMRGAHFLSHDLMSLLICWYVSLILSALFFKHLGNDDSMKFHKV